MFVTENAVFAGPRWIINFPTKKHWRQPSQLEWISSGLQDLRSVIQLHGIRSIALPPLGAGNGGLEWLNVREAIENSLADLFDVDIIVYEPAGKYLNVSKRTGVEELTEARALIAEMVRRYWVLGIECTYLEVQKLGWFLERTLGDLGSQNPLNLRFDANRYGPYSDRLRHLLNGLDGTYLHCDKRLSDAGPTDTIWFDEGRRERTDLFLKQENHSWLNQVIQSTAELIEGFESPFGMELLATVDWLLREGRVEATLESVRAGMAQWPAGAESAARKLRIFDERATEIALNRLMVRGRTTSAAAEESSLPEPLQHV
jgi:hypothetical protein